MSKRLKIAAIQLESTLDRKKNLMRCEAYLRDAVSDGAEVCVLPELFSCLGPEKDCYETSETLTGQLSAWGSATASRMGCFLVMGSFIEKAKRGRTLMRNLENSVDEFSSSEGDSAEGLTCIDANLEVDIARLAAIRAKNNLPYNTCCVFDNYGNLVTHYRKIHLFDCNLKGAGSRESDLVRAGKKTETVKIDNAWTMGLGICYDLRFPEQFRELKKKGANIMVVPAAFTMETGREHWEILLRARAIENQCYVVAANQCGTAGVRRYGHSMIVDPWGTVIAQSAERPGIVMAELDHDYLIQLRQSFPFG